MMFAIFKRYILTFILVSFVVPCFCQDAKPTLQPHVPTKEDVKILVLGDSLSAEFGLE